MIRFKEYLEEKLIIVGKGARYGQIVILAGGAASGKGFVIKNFLEGEKFKVFDVDELKKSFVKLARLKNTNPELQNLNLRQPQDVTLLHRIISKKGIKDRIIGLILQAANKDRLPNLLFDVTLKNLNDMNKLKSMFLDAGYLETSINIVWVLADFSVAIRSNRERDRVVPDDIVLQTHVGAANTMYDILKGTFKNVVDGGIYVVLNNRDNTIWYPNGQKSKLIKGFKYIQVKKPGKPIESKAEIQDEIYNWVIENIPKTKDTERLFRKEDTLLDIDK